MIMVHYAKHSFRLLIGAVVIFGLCVEAREFKFFSKATRDTGDNHDGVVDAILLAPTPAPEPAPAFSGEGYGLYGHESNNGESNDANTENFGQNYNQKVTRYPYNYNGYNGNNNNNNAYYDHKYENSGYVNNGYKSNNYNEYGNDGYANGKLGTGDTRFMENAKHHNNVDRVNNYDNEYMAERGIRGKGEGYNGNSENYGSANQKLGMSGTSFWENGKHYNNVENANVYDNRYKADTRISGKGEGYYGNSENEFDTMEEYEKQQGYTQIQGEFAP